MSTNEAVAVAKKQRSSKSEEITLSTGYTVKLHPVSQLTIQEAQARIKYPPVPKIYDEVKGREYENSNDPAYLRGVDETNIRRGTVALDIALLMGVEVEMPENDDWLKGILKMERMGILDLSEFDLADPVDREFLFKKHVVFGSPTDVALLMVNVNAVSEEAIAAAMENFRRPA